MRIRKIATVISNTISKNKFKHPAKQVLSGDNTIDDINNTNMIARITKIENKQKNPNAIIFLYILGDFQSE